MRKGILMLTAVAAPLLIAAAAHATPYGPVKHCHWVNTDCKTVHRACDAPAGPPHHPGAPLPCQPGAGTYQVCSKKLVCTEDGDASAPGLLDSSTAFGSHGPASTGTPLGSVNSPAVGARIR